MTLDAAAFTAFERTAHDRIASQYEALFTPLTRLALDALLRATGASQGQRLLDVGTGPGIAAAAAHARGMIVTGVDVSPGMIALARETCPGIDFQVADVLSLPFPSGSFDVVICNFVLGHFPAPDKALSECARVLTPDGAMAFSWWDLPVRQRVQGLFREAIVELGLPPSPDVPQGHDMLRFSCPTAFAALLSDAGLTNVTVTAHHTSILLSDMDVLWRTGMGGLAVTASAVTAQDEATQARVRDATSSGAERYRTASGYEVPVAFLIGSGRLQAGRSLGP